ETAYQGQAPWDIGKPQKPFMDVADHEGTNPRRRGTSSRCFVSGLARGMRTGTDLANKKIIAATSAPAPPWLHASAALRAYRPRVFEAAAALRACGRVRAPLKSGAISTLLEKAQRFR